MLGPQRLAVLREFAAQGTVARAAEALAFTPSAVSQQLTQLQREAGVELFRKVGRRLELTDAGRTLVERADELLARFEQIEAELAAQSGAVSGHIRVAAFQTAARSLVLPALGLLAEEHGDLEVSLYEEEAEDSQPLVQRGRLDMAIAEEYDHAPRPRTAELDRVYLEPDEMLLALPKAHPSARDGGAVALRDLHTSRWVTAREGTAYAEMCERICRSVGDFEPDILHRGNDMQLLLDLVAAGCVALVPSLGQPHRHPGVAVQRALEGPFKRAIFVAMRASDRRRPSTGAVVEALSRISSSQDPRVG